MATVIDIGTLIVRTPGIRGGRPRIAATGVTVRRIVGWYKLGFSPEEIAANREEIEADIAAEEEEAERLEREHYLSRIPE